MSETLYNLLRSLHKTFRQVRPVELSFSCPVCGAAEFGKSRVLWNKLVREWELSQAERNYTDNQQGLFCRRCESNLRSMTLASAVLSHWKLEQNFREICARGGVLWSLQVLEINEAGQLSSHLAALPGHILATYPTVNMQAMTYENESFDLILHSDTLEHVPDPVQALRECRRVLKSTGVMTYTVPVIFGRATRRRDGLPPSYHGSILNRSEGYRVVTEYGHDFYLQASEAGFRSVSMHSLLFPDSTALICCQPLVSARV